MDEQRFDELARLLANGGSRRRLLRSVAGLAAGLLVGVGRGGGAAAVHHCGDDLNPCGPDLPPCCPGFACDPNTLTCRLNCTGRGESCSVDSDCCPQLFCVNGICNFQPECTGLATSCTSDEECGCFDSQFGPGYCHPGVGQCFFCSPESGGCERDGDCCPGYGLQCLARTCQFCDEEGQPCVVGTCCAGLTCSSTTGIGVCQAPPPPCVGAGQPCGAGDVCCDDLQCVEGVCSGRPCAGAGEACAGDADCCGDLVCGGDGTCGVPCRGAGESCADAPQACCTGLACVDGVCAVPCLGAGESCAADPDGCCAGLVCAGGVCGAPGGGAATVTIHKATCPTGGEAGTFEACNGNALAGVAFAVNGTGVVTGGNGAAAASVEAGQVTVAEDAGTFAAYLGAYVYCAEQSSGTVLFDGSADAGSVAFTVDDGDDVVCDWYNITPAADGDGNGDGDRGPNGGSDGATSLPATGSGAIVGGAGESTPWLGAALLGGAAALLAGKRLRDGTAPPEATD